MNEQCCNYDCNQGRDCPLRNKEPTDEEIRAIHEQTDGNLNMIEFARAVLKMVRK